MNGYKCLCGYEHIPEWDERFKRLSDHEKRDNEEFKRLRGDFRIDVKDSYYSDSRDIQIYACPKCGTLKIIE